MNSNSNVFASVEHSINVVCVNRCCEEGINMSLRPIGGEMGGNFQKLIQYKIFCLHSFISVFTMSFDGIMIWRTVIRIIFKIVTNFKLSSFDFLSKLILLVQKQDY